MEAERGGSQAAVGAANKAECRRRSRSLAPPGPGKKGERRGRIRSRSRSRAAAGANKAECRRRSISAPPGKMMGELTPWARRVTDVCLFLWLALADFYVYSAMTEEDVEEEYRKAGKLHRYNPDNELQKRLARVARKWPPPEGFMPEIEEYYKLIDDDDRDAEQE